MTGIERATKRAGACSAEAAEPSLWQKDRMTRQQRLYRAMLLPASSELVEQRPKDAKWFCLIVVDGAELNVERRLKDGGVEVLVPREKFRKLRKGVEIDGERASFTGYVFVRMVWSALAIERIKRVKAVLDFLHNGERYHEVPEHALGFYLDPNRMAADKSIGDGCAARCKFGAFAGLDCVVLQVKDPKSRTPIARIWITEYQREIRNVPLAFLEKL